MKAEINKTVLKESIDYKICKRGIMTYGLFFFADGRIFVVNFVINNEFSVFADYRTNYSIISSLLILHY